ncbi:cupredoxin domain-containing protein [Streptomyces sp. NPDC059578]|uniref:cupredoxin domain-containing protein n=1 Tax=Streptomyces sp. NPDC059578 TaxID=3346874 RepID=UPI0036D0B861
MHQSAPRRPPAATVRRLPHRSVAALLAALWLTQLTACSNGGGGEGPSPSATSAPAVSSPAAGRTVVVIRDFAFVPAEPEVAPGAEVTVVNEDSVAHTLTATGSASFDTGDIAAGATATFTAPDKAGRYPYTCTIHPSMKGTLVVR